VTTPVIDRDGRSTVAAAEAQAALASGDTPRAQEKYREAGALLERCIPNHRRQSEKHLIRFLAATQYYKGGLYHKALNLCEHIQKNLLPPDVVSLFPPFIRDVKSRASADYTSRVRKELLRSWTSQDNPRILGLLQDHPYVLPPGGVAFFRAVICENMKSYEAAAAFYAEALRWNPNDPSLIFAAVALPLKFPSEARIDEAWEYVQKLLKTIPHAATFAVASIVCFHRATAAADDKEQRRLSNDQIRYFDEAWAAYLSLSKDQAKDPELYLILDLAFETAAISLFRLGEQLRAKQVCDEAIRLGPHSPNTWTVRGIVTYPSDGAVADFQNAIALGDDTYFPYFYLAHNALARSDYSGAVQFCQEALKTRAKPNRRIEASLYGWLASSKYVLGSEKDEVETLFHIGRQIDPENLDLEENYRVFREGKKEPRVRPAREWGQVAIQHALDRMKHFPVSSPNPKVLVSS